MSINGISPIVQNSVDRASSQRYAVQLPESSPTPNQEKTTSLNYNVHDMSLSELTELTKHLYDSGQITMDERKQVAMERFVQEFCGVSPDERLDMVSFFQDNIDIMKSQPQSKGVELLERTLDILKGVDARTHANIPNAV